MAYECDKCQRAYSSQYNLNKHIRISNIKPCYAKNFNKTCQYCNRIFSSVQVCKNHMNGTCKMIPSADGSLLNISEIKQSDITPTKDIDELQDQIALLISDFKKKTRRFK